MNNNVIEVFYPTVTKPKKKSKLKIILLVGIPIILLIVFAVLYFTVISPKNKYDKAMNYFDNKNYKEAIELFEELNGYKDTKEKLNRAYFEYGKELLVAEKFADAVRNLEKTSTIGNSNYLKYARALSAMDFVNYDEAIQELTLLGDFEKAPVYLKQTYYLYGDSLAEAGRYDSAIAQFVLADDFGIAKEKIKMCNLLKAEKLYKEGLLSDAKAIYDKIDKDFEHEGIKVSDRLDTFKKYAGYVSLAGSWKGTNGELLVKHIRKGVGSWDSWKNTYNSNLDIKCVINEDGSVKISGSTSFFTFTNYSDKAENVKYDNIEVPIELEVKAGVPAPGTLVDKYPALKLDNKAQGYVSIKYFNNNKIVLNFKLEDVNFSKTHSNEYTSTVTYTKVK